MSTFHTFRASSIFSSVSCLAAGTVEYTKPTLAALKLLVFEVGKTYRIKCQYKIDSSIEYEVLITSICEKYIEADYLTLIEGGNEESWEGTFFLSDILEVVEIESWAKYYTYGGHKCFADNGGGDGYLMRKSGVSWAPYDKAGTNKAHSKEDGEFYDRLVKNGTWVETTPEKAFGRH